MSPVDSAEGDDFLSGAFHWTLLVVVLIAGATVRFWRITDCGLSMWDEYSYVRAARWISTLGQEGHPLAPNVAPPLYPVWMAICFLIAGYHDWVAIGASAVASFLTLPALYALGSRVYGRSAALVAAAFLATNPYNVIFARQAITDATFQFLFVAAAGALFLLARTAERRWIWGGGIALGLCQMTKYHGFFAWFAAMPEALRGVGRRAAGAITPIRRLVVAAAIAAAIVLPWIVVVAHEWGLGRLLRHYLGFSSFKSAEHGSWRHLVAYLRLWCGPYLPLASGVGLFGMVQRPREGDRLVLAWITLFAAGVFLYFAYPRLLLPLMSGLALAAGRAVLLVRSGRVRGIVAAGMTVTALALGGAGSVPHLGPYGGGYRAAGAYLASRIASGETLATLGQPLLWFYAGRPLPDLREPEVQRRLRAGEPLIFAVDLAVFKFDNQRLLETNRNAFEPVMSFENPMSEPDILTTLGIDRFAEYRRNPKDPRWDLARTIQVFRVTRPWKIGDE